ncbi:hypothetical protein, partial [Alistipes finegoldii]|uniref:hypothetical protein n=1 Tax=Alistipes finegoldii TaxID=214856 RepID=UPI003AB3369F
HWPPILLDNKTAAARLSPGCCPVSFQMSHVSTVPNSSSPRSARSRPPGIFELFLLLLPKLNIRRNGKIDDGLRQRRSRSAK